MFHRDCVHEMPAESFELFDGPNDVQKLVVPGGHAKLVPPCKHEPRPQHGAAWKAWTQFHQGALTNLYGEGTVPPNPPQDEGQTLFFWDGIEPDDNSAVLQPVLQYGVSAAGGGSYWAIASWYVSTTTVYYTKVYEVAVGETILGNLTFNANNSWTTTGTIKSTGKAAKFTMKPPKTSDYTWGYTVLEAYNVDDCSNVYPTTNKIVFNNLKATIARKPITPQWQVMTQTTTCSENAQIASPAQTSITWNS